MLTAAGHRALLGALAVLALAAGIVAAFNLGDSGDGEGIAAVGPMASAPTTTAAVEGDGSGPVTSIPSSDTTVPPTTTAVPADVSVPVGAVGAFTVAAGQTEAAGTGGLVTYTVEVEDAVGYSADEFARIVDETLSDPRSWIADGSVSFQRVPSGGQIRIVLATPATTDQLCLPLDTAGIFSCHQGGTVALNSGRWMNGAETWPGPLEEFRHYAVNHEVGHAIGHGHTDCTTPGQPAPIMMQQSKGLEGCLPNGWVYPTAA